MTYTKTLNVELNKQGADGKNAITMTSATTPSGEYNGQIGIWQGQLYQWDGNFWKLTSGILPTDPVLHYSFDDDINEYTPVEIDNGALSVDNGTGTLNLEDENNLLVNFTKETLQMCQISFKIYGLTTGTILSFDIETNNASYANVIYYSSGSYIIDGVLDLTQKRLIYKYNGNNSRIILQIYAGKKGQYCNLKNISIVKSKNLPIIDNASGKYNIKTYNNLLSTKGENSNAIKLYKNSYAICNFTIPQDFSCSVWCKPENNATGLTQNIVYNDSFVLRNGASWGTYLMAYCFTQKEDGTYDDTILRDFYSDLLQTDVFTHIVFTKNKNVLKLYINGKLVQNQTRYSDVMRNSDTLYIGGQYNDRSQDLDDIQFYNRALSDQEVLGLYLAKGNTPKRFTLNDYRLNLIDDDGVISVSEKKELLRRWKEIYNAEKVSTSLPTSNISANGEYKAVIDAANLLNIGSISAITTYREATNALRDAFWGSNGYLNNMTTASTLSGNLDSLFANYRQALQNANNAISDQQSAQASAITVQMASPFIQLPVSASGSVTSYENSGNVITVLNGALTLTPVISTATLNDNQYSISASGSGITAGTVSVDSTNKKVAIGNSTALTKTNAQITYTIKFKINGTTGTLYAQQKISTASRGADGKRGPMYRGTTKPTTDVVSGDWYLDKSDNLIHVYNNSNWNTTITNYDDYRYTPALNDMLAIAAEKPDVGFIKIATAHIQNLAAGNILANVLTTKELKLTDKGVIKSENYGETTGGFEIKADGQATFANIETPIVLTPGNICFMRCMDVSSYGNSSNETLSVKFKTKSQGLVLVEVQLFDLGGSTNGTTFSGTLKIDEDPITINNVYTYKTSVIRLTTKGISHSVKFELTGKSRTYPVVMVVSLGEGNLSKTSWGYKQLVENIEVETKTFNPDGSYSWNLFFTPSRISAKTNINVAKSYAGTKDEEKNLVMPFFQNYPRNGTFPEFFATTPLCYGHGAISGLYKTSNVGGFGGYTVYLPVFWANKNQEASIIVYRVSVLIEGKWNDLDLGTIFYL